MRAVDVGLYYAALTTVLTIPHVCAALERDDGRANGNHYAGWCRRYVCDELRVLADVIYSLRCGVLHQGPASVKRAPQARGAALPIESLMFTLPGTSMLSARFSLT